MPPFRQGSIEVSPKLDGDALKQLRDAGHGHRINIVDASYDIPEGSKVIKFPGSSAEALAAIVRVVPVEGEADGVPDMFTMSPDCEFAEVAERDHDHISMRAVYAFGEVIHQLNEEALGGQGVDWSAHDNIQRLDSEVLSGEGFYTLANDTPGERTYVRTIDDLPFACASLVVGHSQRTE